ncbi:complement C1q tumor necrosis factor-related protein 3-like [Mytilus edulis]|uniref:complement C1q tumor necrosis factor-related protein 3-like n=1 Tax=Mytilus edulis TaxID=6550 RepID=UPI0039EE6DEC
MSVGVLFFIFISFVFANARGCEGTELNGSCCRASCDSINKVEEEYAAFTAITTNGDALPNGPIIYDKVVTNVGKAYSARSGIFHAPVPGVYSFTFSLMGFHSNTVYMYLYKNNAEVTRLYTNGGGRHEVASNTVYLSLKKGDEVYTKGTEGKKLYAAEPYNLFSGVLIKKGNF